MSRSSAFKKRSGVIKEMVFSSGEWLADKQDKFSSFPFFPSPACVCTTRWYNKTALPQTPKSKLFGLLCKRMNNSKAVASSKSTTNSGWWRHGSCLLEFWFPLTFYTPNNLAPSKTRISWERKGSGELQGDSLSPPSVWECQDPITIVVQPGVPVLPSLFLCSDNGAKVISPPWWHRMVMLHLQEKTTLQYLPTQWEPSRSVGSSPFRSSSVTHTCAH